MPITYTTNLGLEHLDPGQANKDATLNDFMDGVDKSLAQYLAYTVTASATLTNSQASYMMIEFIGSPGAARTIKLPLNKVYLFQNSVAGGYSVYVCGTNGGYAPTIEIPNGKSLLVYNKDDNEIYAISYGADKDAAYLLNGAIPTGMGAAVNIQAASNLEFIASATNAIPLAVKAFSAGQTADLFRAKSSAGASLMTIDASGDINLQSSQKILNLPNASASTDALPKGQADGLYAPIGARYLTNGAESGLSAEENIANVTSTLEFIASANNVTPLAVRSAATPSVDIFQVKNSGGTAQWGINSSFEMDAKTHKIKNVVDPAAAQDAATKNYHDTTSYGMVLNFCADSLTVSVGTTYFAWVNFITTAANTTERWIPVPSAGKIAKLRVIAGVAPAGGSVTFTVRKKTAGGGAGAGSDTALTCTLALGATLATDLSNSFTVAAGDEISVKIVENAGYSGSAARIMISMELTLA